MTGHLCILGALSISTLALLSRGLRDESGEDGGKKPLRMPPSHYRHSASYRPITGQTYPPLNAIPSSLGGRAPVIPNSFGVGAPPSATSSCEGSIAAEGDNKPIEGPCDVILKNAVQKLKVGGVLSGPYGEWNGYTLHKWKKCTGRYYRFEEIEQPLTTRNIPLAINNCTNHTKTGKWWSMTRSIKAHECCDDWYQDEEAWYDFTALWEHEFMHEQIDDHLHPAICGDVTYWINEKSKFIFFNPISEKAAVWDGEEVHQFSTFSTNYIRKEYGLCNDVPK